MPSDTATRPFAHLPPCTGRDEQHLGPPIRSPISKIRNRCWADSAASPSLHATTSAVCVSRTTRWLFKSRSTRMKGARTTFGHRTARVLKTCCLDFNSIRSLSLTGWHPETLALPWTCWSATVMLGRGCAFHQIPSRSSAMSPNQILARRITFTSASTLRLAGRPRAARRTSFTTLSGGL